MNRLRISALCLLLAAASLAADSNRIVLRVNDHIVTLTDFQLRYGERLRGIQQAQMPDDERARRLAGLGESVFREMFDELLMLSRASHLGLEVTEAMIEDSMTQMREANDLNDTEKFEAALAQSGVTREQLRDQARQNLLLQQVMAQELRSRVALNEEDLRRYYQSHLDEFAVGRRMNLRSIVVLDASGLDEAAREGLAAEAIEVLRGGADVEDWVAGHSEAGETTSLIDLGWVGDGDLASELQAPVWDLEAGAVAAPIASRGGLHIVQVLETEEAHVRPFSEVSAQVERLEMARLQRDATSKMLTEFEENSYVRIDPPEAAAGFRSSRAVVEDGFEALQATEPAGDSTTEDDPLSGDGGSV